MIKLYFIVSLLFFGISLNAQQEMLIEQLSERLVIRENYDEKGAYLNKQTFTIGKLNKRNGYFEIEVLTEFFDENIKSTDKYTTTYRCKPEESTIMVMAFPFSNPKSKEIEINTNSKNFKKLYDLDNLNDVELEMSFDSGLLNFFGSKSIIKIYNRTLDGNKTNIKSKVKIKAYALGFPIKQLNYTLSEVLNTKGLLTFQKFTEEDNSYFTITFK